MLRNSNETKHKAHHLMGSSYIAPTPPHTVSGEDPVHTHGVGCVLQGPSTAPPQPHIEPTQVPTHMTGISTS